MDKQERTVDGVGVVVEEFRRRENIYATGIGPVEIRLMSHAPESGKPPMGRATVWVYMSDGNTEVHTANLENHLTPAQIQDVLLWLDMIRGIARAAILPESELNK